MAQSLSEAMEDFPEAERLAEGIWAGEREWTYRDPVSMQDITVRKMSGQELYVIAGISPYYARSGYGVIKT